MSHLFAGENDETCDTCIHYKVLDAKGSFPEDLECGYCIAMPPQVVEMIHMIPMVTHQQVTCYPIVPCSMMTCGQYKKAR